MQALRLVHDELQVPVDLKRWHAVVFARPASTPSGESSASTVGEAAEGVDASGEGLAAAKDDLYAAALEQVRAPSHAWV